MMARPAKDRLEPGPLQRRRLTIPKGNPKAEMGQKLIKFCAHPERQAEFAKHIAYGPTNPNAYKTIDKQRAAILPTNPDFFSSSSFRATRVLGTEPGEAD
jgi:spermidine/putrescine-binding protein